MKNLFKQTRVIYDAHLKEYRVEYKNFLFWKFDCNYKVDKYTKDNWCKENAVARAKAMLETVEIYRGKQVYY